MAIVFNSVRYPSSLAFAFDAKDKVVVVLPDGKKFGTVVSLSPADDMNEAKINVKWGHHNDSRFHQTPEMMTLGDHVIEEDNEFAAVYDRAFKKGDIVTNGDGREGIIRRIHQYIVAQEETSGLILPPLSSIHFKLQNRFSIGAGIECDGYFGKVSAVKMKIGYKPTGKSEHLPQFFLTEEFNDQPDVPKIPHYGETRGLSYWEMVKADKSSWGLAAKVIHPWSSWTAKVVSLEPIEVDVEWVGHSRLGSTAIHEEPDSKIESTNFHKIQFLDPERIGHGFNIPGDHQSIGLKITINDGNAWLANRLLAVEDCAPWLWLHGRQQQDNGNVNNGIYRQELEWQPGTTLYLKEYYRHTVYGVGWRDQQPEDEEEYISGNNLLSLFYFRKDYQGFSQRPWVRRRDIHEILPFYGVIMERSEGPEDFCVIDWFRVESDGNPVLTSTTTESPYDLEYPPEWVGFVPGATVKVKNDRIQKHFRFGTVKEVDPRNKGALTVYCSIHNRLKVMYPYELEVVDMTTGLHKSEALDMFIVTGREETPEKSTARILGDMPAGFLQNENNFLRPFQSVLNITDNVYDAHPKSLPKVDMKHIEDINAQLNQFIASQNIDQERNIFVKTYANRDDVFRVLMVGPPKSELEDSVIIFDMFLAPDHPNAKPTAVMLCDNPSMTNLLKFSPLFNIQHYWPDAANYDIGQLIRAVYDGIFAGPLIAKGPITIKPSEFVGMVKIACFDTTLEQIARPPIQSQVPGNVYLHYSRKGARLIDTMETVFEGANPSFATAIVRRCNMLRRLLDADFVEEIGHTITVNINTEEETDGGDQSQANGDLNDSDNIDE